MSKNPKDNIDTTRSQHLENDRSTYASPKRIDNQVRLDRSDLHDERIERLGQYLSDTTAGRSSNIDVVTSANNNFIISGPDESSNLENEFTQQISKATEIFDELKRSSFDPDVYTRDGVPQNYQRQTGATKDDYLLIQEDTKSTSVGEKSVVEQQIEKEKTMRGSRWNGLGKSRFPNTSTPAAENDLFSGNESSRGELEGTQTRYSNYVHPTGQRPGVNGDQKADSFWDEYYNRMAMVGSSITISATGRDSTADPNDKPRNKGSFNDSGIMNMPHGGNDDLRGSWKLVDENNYQAKNVFQTSGSIGYTSEPTAEQSEKFNVDTFNKSFTSKSYGQLYAWDDPFEPSGFPVGKGRHSGLELAEELLEIYLYMVLRTSLLSAAIQLVNVALGAALGGKGGVANNPWKRTYYPQSPSSSRTPGMLKGTSGYNPKVTNRVKEAPQALGELAHNIGDDFFRYTAVVALQLVGGSIETLAAAVNDDVINVGHWLAKELRLYVPRHIMTQSAIGADFYKKPKEPPKTALEFFDIGTAYAKALTGGFAQLSIELLAKDFGNSSGFWKAVFRDTGRSRIKYNNFVKQENPFEGLKIMLGKDDKHFAFMNYLAQLGDLAAASGVTGALSFPENKVRLESIPVSGQMRTAGSTSRLAMDVLPGLRMRINGQDWSGIVQNVHGGKEIANPLPGKSADFGHGIAGTGSGATGGYTDADNSQVSNRFSPANVQLVEDALEAEHMPFYIQDLRTNEVTVFHAFLTALSDSYSGEWTAQKGFGRIEAAQIYGGGSRSIGLSFVMVSMNPEDLKEMYDRINKLTTLVYPQWSRGTLMSGADNTQFVQPFSQVPTASPLCRVRVGDLFVSNYSIENMARLHGVGDKEFNYGSEADIKKQRKKEEAQKLTAKFEQLKPIYEAQQDLGGVMISAFSSGYPTDSSFNEIIKRYENIGWSKTADKLRKRWNNNIKNDFMIFVQDKIDMEDGKQGYAFIVETTQSGSTARGVDKIAASGVSIDGNSDTVVSLYKTFKTLADLSRFHNKNNVMQEISYSDTPDAIITEEEYTAAEEAQNLANSGNFDPSGGISALFAKGTDGKYNNPILRSFNSTMGRGIAVAMTGISFDWKLNSVPWDLEPGQRVPRMCEVQLSMTPIHDITPGIDHNGFNRAPIYKVGNDHGLEIAGDVWDTGKRKEVNTNVRSKLNMNLNGKDKGPFAADLQTLLDLVNDEDDE